MVDPTLKENQVKFIGESAKDDDSVNKHTQLFVKRFEEFFKKVENECPTSEEINRVITKHKLQNKVVSNNSAIDLVIKAQTVLRRKTVKMSDDESSSEDSNEFTESD